MNDTFSELKAKIQLVIDLAANKQFSEANTRLGEAGDMLDEILDHTIEDLELVEISRYQVLLNQLQVKINTP